MLPRAPARPVLAYFPGVRWDDVAGTDVRLATAIGESADVLWIDPTLSVFRVVRREGPRGLRRGTRVDNPAPGVTRVQIIGPPWPDRTPIRALTRWRLRSASRSLARTRGLTPRAVVVSSPAARDGVFPGARYVYYATDDFVAGAALTRTSPRLHIRDEARQLAVADAVAAVSAVLASRWSDRRDDAVVIPNGCDPALHDAVAAAAPAGNVDLPSPVAGVVGQLSRRIDLELLEAVVSAGCSLLLVGPIDPAFRSQRLDALLDRPGVAWVGRRPVEELPSYYRMMDVGLTPYVVDEFNRASVPLKTLEYLAAGLPVVSTPLPSLSYWSTPLIAVAGTAEEFPVAVARALETGARPDFDELCGAFGRENSWRRRADDILALAFRSEVRVAESSLPRHPGSGPSDA